MPCKKCGKELKEGASFCSNCGTAVTKGLSEPEQKRRKKSFRKAVVGIIVIAALVCAVGGTGYYFRGTPTQNYIGVEKGTRLTEEEADQILLADIPDEEWEMFYASVEEISQIVSEYSNDDGYIESDNTEAVLNAVTEQVDKQYEKGTVTYYLCDSDTISFEYGSGLSAYYTPNIEGYDAGSGDMAIIAVDVFSDEDKNVFTGEYIGDSDESEGSEENTEIITLRYLSSDRTASILSEALPDSSIYSWKNFAVDLEELSNLPEGDFLLWYGHGAFCDDEYPVLDTQEEFTTGSEFREFFDVLSVSCVKCTIDGWAGEYWAITPVFVKKYMSFDQGLVYLAACQSGRNDALADAFMYSGAETVFVNVGEGDVNTFYDQWMMKTIIGYMSGEYDDIYHTAKESLDLSHETLSCFFSGNGVNSLNLWDVRVKSAGGYSSLEEYIEKENGGTHVEIRGEGAYTICSCIRGEITFDDDMTQDEISDVLETLSVELFTEDGTSVGTAAANEDSTFYFNNLDPGTYEAVLYQSGKQICESVSVNVEKHRYTSVSLPYSQLVTLEGYVYDEEGNPLSGVLVEATMSAGTEQWSDTAKTDENGYYQIEVSGMNQNRYILNYSLEGYTSVENTFTVTENYNTWKNNSVELDDVVLEKILDIPADALEYNGHYYYVYSNCSTWEEAKEYCESLGGYLAVISDSYENDVLYDYITSMGYENAYFGYSDSVTEGVWKWVSNEKSNYSNWVGNEPNEENENEDYAMFYYKYYEGDWKGGWNDGDFDDSTVRSERNFICEWNPEE